MLRDTKELVNKIDRELHARIQRRIKLLPRGVIDADE
jgi:hypothetical protein